VLIAEDLRKVYRPDRRAPVEAVAGVSLRVGAGEVVAVCGRSGAGKSTLLAMLGGICRPTAGRVAVAGQDVWSLVPAARAALRARCVGFVFQAPSLLPALRAADNVALPALLAGRVGLDAAYARAAELLAGVGLAGRLEAYPGELSGGEQRRVALARALINQPPLLLADEPVAGLDEETEAESLDRLLDLARGTGAAVVLVSHRPELVRRADRVLHLRAGRLVEDAVPAPPVVRPRRPAPTSVAPPVAPSAPGPALPPALPGAGVGRLARRLAAGTVAVVAAILVRYAAIAALQHRSVASAAAARRELERTALRQLRADVESVAYGPGGTYRLTLYLQNLDPARELFVLVPGVQVFIQGERGWEEVPSWPADGRDAGVTRLTGRRQVAYAFRPDVSRFEEIVAGYYHVRVVNPMLVGRQRDPGPDLVDRTDAYYIYLKPHGTDDGALLRRNGWAGAAAPLWIPMPPH
jgi:putative ABC transport system ATP-binding protein/macrolide transport system ATP-binding/permease protein/lipoprotein-releasing system ATP-binding protein